MRFIRVIACCLLSFVAVFAQSDRGTITGTVTDNSGAVVPRANVIAVYAESGTEVPVATTETGNYTIASLRPGIYNLTVEAAGFKKATKTGILVAVASNVRIDVMLEVGSATETLTVTAEAPLLQTEDATPKPYPDGNTDGEPAHQLRRDQRRIHSQPVGLYRHGARREQYRPEHHPRQRHAQQYYRNVRLKGRSPGTS